MSIDQQREVDSDLEELQNCKKIIAAVPTVFLPIRSWKLDAESQRLKYVHCSGRNENGSWATAALNILPFIRTHSSFYFTHFMKSGVE